MTAAIASLYERASATACCGLLACGPGATEDRTCMSTPPASMAGSRDSVMSASFARSCADPTTDCGN